MGLIACDGGDTLDEIEDALRLSAFLSEHRVNDLRGLGFREAPLMQEFAAVLVGAVGGRALEKRYALSQRVRKAPKFYLIGVVGILMGLFAGLISLTAVHGGDDRHALSFGIMAILLLGVGAVSIWRWLAVTADTDA